MEHLPAPRAVSVVLNVTEDGRVIIPATAIAELGLRASDSVSASLVDGEIVVDTLDAAIKRMQAEVRRHVPEGVSLVDELIAERRAEAARE
jgi:bifunctional DNA-binding transcriptional regulator/antitoxin component of YhaV-PrlF toxin-antitoxin module